MIPWLGVLLSYMQKKQKKTYLYGEICVCLYGITTLRTLEGVDRRRGHLSLSDAELDAFIIEALTDEINTLIQSVVENCILI